MDNAALTRRWFEEVWNQNRADTIEELLDPDVVIHGLDSSGDGKRGREHFREFFQLFRSGLSEIHVDVEDVIAAGDKTVARLKVQALHSGDGMGVPATGRRIHATAIVISRWKDGRIVEGWNEFDAAGMMRQLTDPPAVKLRT